MAFFDMFKEWFNNNPGKGVGLIVGGVFGMLIFVFGFWKLLIIIMLMVIGVFVGKLVDDKVSLSDLFSGRFKKH